MATTSHSSLLVCLFIATILVLSTIKAVNVEVPTYTVNLDQPPKERWAHVVSDYSQLYPLLVNELYNIIPKPIVEAITAVTSVLDHYMPQPYADEIRGIAKYTNSSVGETLMGNLAYDFTAFHHSFGSINETKRGACTSILSLTPNGTLLHGRNLDYAFKNLIRNFTINVEFESKGRLVFKATTFAGMIGVFTGMRPGGLSISLDQRNTGEVWSNIFDAIRTKFHGMVGVVIREVLTDTSMNYNSAVKKLSQIQLIAPCFLIVGSPGKDGVVITRDRSKAVDVWFLNTTKSWFLVETNYDHWEKPPSSDNRRDPAIKMLNSLGHNNMSITGLYNVLSTYPVLNKATAYTTLMSSNTGYYHAVIRYP